MQLNVGDLISICLVCRSYRVHEQCWVCMAYSMLECKVHVCFEILVLLSMADMDCLFMWKAVECMSSEECSVYLVVVDRLMSM